MRGRASPPSLDIAIIGGGPAGLYLATLVKLLNTKHRIEVWERNAADDTFGFGVVFSDETLSGIENADSAFYERLTQSFAVWDDIDVHFKHQVLTSGGHGFAAISRQKLLAILRDRCEEFDVTIHYRRPAPALAELRRSFDLVVAADGVNSLTRAAHEETFQPRVDVRHARYMWLGTPLVFDAFKFFIAETDIGTVQAHAYPYSDAMSTFIVELAEEAWNRSGQTDSADRSWKPGENDAAGIEFCAEVFKDDLDGAALIGNNSRWIRFPTVRTRCWRDGNVLLIGDAAHTAHFSIGSGTKLAMEDALALAACLHENPTVEKALIAYETERRPVVESSQRAAQASLEWFENISQYVHQEPLQFAFNLLTRSRRVTYSNLKVRDPEFVTRVEKWFSPNGDTVPPMFVPFRLRELELANRVIVSPMDMYTAEDGLIGDFHLVHLGSKALGGAALVMAEMVCVSREGRISPGCAGMYKPEHEPAYRRLVDFVHQQTPAMIGLQLGHSGRKGSTKLMWEGMDEPLEADKWELMAPSPVPYLPASQIPREMTRADMQAVLGQFVEATRMAVRAGFDLLELHCAHGYLLASFISPLTNRRNDEYGGTLQNRLRYPLEVFDAIRGEWPAEKPMTVRLSATDWFEGGLSAEESVAVARAFAEHGVDAIDVSTGQTVAEEQPSFGRSYQTPFSDRIRNRLGVATIAVGAISSYDDVNTIILAGRADFCALGRAHLYDPAWTLHAAAEQDVPMAWPVQFQRGSRKPPSGRTDGPRPRLELIRGEARSGHRRWRPRPQ
ncbi:MAG TPA: bifunctional salicylyl-CoA 5-hydroxylase/oxidoreductase [Candidatus Dormibacteraeota bacterium]|nr:bifunctional salicylyl-CoA 5-hydroxylase/oxidoreductase [Candidatus Dormibacteraeota bacterium]